MKIDVAPRERLKYPPRRFKTTGFANTTQRGDDGFSAVWSFRMPAERTGHQWVLLLRRAGTGGHGVLESGVALDKMLAAASRRVFEWQGTVPEQLTLALRDSDLS